MIEADRGGDDGIGGGEDPPDDGHKVHPVKDHPVTDGEALVLTDKGDAGGGR